MVIFEGRQVNIVRSARAARTRLYVSVDGEVTIELPEGTRVDEAQLQAFVDRHKRFLRTRLRNADPARYPDFADGGKVRLLGKEYVVRRVDGSGYRLQGDALVAPTEWDEGAACAFFAEIFCPYAEWLAEWYAGLYGMKYRQVKLDLSQTSWGVYYPQKGLIIFNLHLVFLPTRLAEYVAAHELCHSRHPDHSPAFWADVERVYPGYRETDKELSTYDLRVLKARASLGSHVPKPRGKAPR